MPSPLSHTGAFFALLLLTAAIPIARKSPPSALLSATFTPSDTNTYNHAVGGGRWRDRVPSLARESQRTLKCGEIASFFLALETAPKDSDAFGRSGEADADAVLHFDADSSGVSGLAFENIVAVGLNTGDDSMTLSNPDSPPTVAFTQTLHGALFETSKTAYSTAADDASTPPTTIPYTRLELRVSHLRPAEHIVLRIDSKIGCQAGASPTGTLNARLVSASAAGRPAKTLHGSAGAAPQLRLARLASVSECPCVKVPPARETRTCYDFVGPVEGDEDRVRCSLRTCVNGPSFRCVESSATTCRVTVYDREVLSFETLGEEHGVCRFKERTLSKYELI